MSDITPEEFIKYAAAYAQTRLMRSPDDDLAKVMLRRIKRGVPEDFIRDFHAWCAGQRLSGAPFDNIAQILCEWARDLTRADFSGAD